MYTDKDEKSIIEGQKNDIALLNQKIQDVYLQDARRVRAISHAVKAMDEAIGMATRLTQIPVMDGDGKSRKQRAEAVALVAYFNECKRNFHEELDGHEVALAERPDLDASPRNNVSKGRKQGNTKQEHSGDSGEAATGVGNSGGAEQQET